MKICKQPAWWYRLIDEVCHSVCVCAHKSVTVVVEPENEEVEFLWKRFVSMVYYEVFLLILLFCTSQLHYTQLFSFWTA